MRLTGTIHLAATIDLDATEATILAELCSFNLADWFATNASRKIPAEEIKKALSRLRDTCAKILKARDQAAEVIVNANR